MIYDVQAIALRYGMDQKYIEKALRISDFLYKISKIKSLGGRLALYGGTALNFIHFKDLPRISIDLDFNYLQIGEKEWYEQRDEIDGYLKKLLKDSGYTEIAIQVYYPLLRMDVSYKNFSGSKDSFKIEIGYMRRMPVLHCYTYGSFYHMGTKEYFDVLTPQKEELFSNKLATLLNRRSGRDLFDTYMISKSDFDQDLLRKCLIIESLMSGLELHKLDIDHIVKDATMDTYLKNLLRIQIPEDIFETVRTFLTTTIQALKTDEIRFIERFFEDGSIDLNLLHEKRFNPSLHSHPLLQWQAKKIKARKS